VSDLLDEASRRARHYLAALDARAVAPSPQALTALARFDGPLPEHTSSAMEVLAELDEFGSPATMASAGGRFFGFVIGGSLPVTVAASWLASAWDQNAGLVATSPINARLEEVALDWVKGLFHLPAESAGGFVTSATAANFCALAAARHALLERAGWDVEAQGLFGAPPITVVVGEEVHASVQKALSMAGFGRERVVRVPCDVQGRMRLEEFPAVTERTIVCVQAGNVNTGAFDPVAGICRRAREQGAWVHVDGAFGLWAAAAPARAHLAGGTEEADSWATDAHKWLNVPYDSGLVFTRDAGALRAAMAVGGAYLAQAEDRIPYQYTPDFSRRARGIEVCAASAGSRRTCGSHRAYLPVRGAIRPGPGAKRAPDTERGGAEPGAGVLRQRRAHACGDCAGPERRDLLVRRHALAGPHGDAHQRFIVGDDRGGRRSQPGRHPACSGGLASRRGLFRLAAGLTSVSSSQLTACLA